MSDSGSNRDDYYPLTSLSEEETEHSHREPLPDMTQPTYMSNAVRTTYPFWYSAPAVPQQPFPQTTRQPAVTLPPQSTQEVSQPSQAWARQSGRYITILPRPPPPELRYNNSRPHPAESDRQPSHPETSLTPYQWFHNDPVAQSQFNQQPATAPEGPTLPPLRANTANHASGSVSPMSRSQSSHSAQSGEPITCTHEGCTYDGTFNRSAELRRHLKTKHVNPQYWPCDIKGCGSGYSRKDNLMAHIKRHHPGTDI